MTRKIFFWLHLSAGLTAGAVIFIMSLTGILLAWQRQIIHWADRDFRHAPSISQGVKLSPEELLGRVGQSKHLLPSAFTMRSDPAEPAAAEFGRDAIVYLNPWTGEVLGEGSQSVRAFFRSVENWHRWLAVAVESRATGKGITGAANLLFLGLLLSGLYLWLPKRWTRQHLRPAIAFRRGLRGRARNWNWHNTIGIWCVLPLLVIVGSGVVMSYPWANDLVYRMTGNEPPAQNGGRNRGDVGGASKDISVAGLNALWQRAEAQTPDWKSITMRTTSSPKAPVQFQLDSGDGGRPDLRSQLTLDRKTGEVVRWEPFNHNNSGRQLRSWIRFSHTGEAGGVLGETVAALASLGGTLLVWTGMSLGLQRIARTFSRRSETAETAGTSRRAA
jgi:uncharacterized iron-regulated membrane protein